MNLENLNPIAIRVDTTGGVLVRDESLDFQAWIDVWIENDDVRLDWNKYIFHHHNYEDMREQEMQKNCDLFDAFTSVAVYKLEELGYIGQYNEKGEWKQFKDFGEVWDIKEN